MFKRLENIKNKNEAQLQAIKDQREKQLKEFKNIDKSKTLKAIDKISKKKKFPYKGNVFKTKEEESEEKSIQPHRFKLDLTDKLNLKNPNRNMALANLSIYYTWKNSKSKYNNKKLGVIVLIYLMILILMQIFKIILNLSLKNMKL